MLVRKLKRPPLFHNTDCPQARQPAARSASPLRLDFCSAIDLSEILRRKERLNAAHLQP